jgi:hypothetical protein
MLEWKRLLVDGAHWSAQKKFKAHNTKGKGGHLGCSEGYYKFPCQDFAHKCFVSGLTGIVINM